MVKAYIRFDSDPHQIQFGPFYVRRDEDVEPGEVPVNKADVASIEDLLDYLTDDTWTIIYED